MGLGNQSFWPTAMLQNILMAVSPQTHPMVLNGTKREMGTRTAFQTKERPAAPQVPLLQARPCLLLLLTVGIQDTSAVHVPCRPDGSHASAPSELWSWASLTCSIACIKHALIAWESKTNLRVF